MNISHQFQSSNLHSLQTFKPLQRAHLLFYLDLKTHYDYRFMKEIIFQLLLGCPMAYFGPLLSGQPH